MRCLDRSEDSGPSHPPASQQAAKGPKFPTQPQPALGLTGCSIRSPRTTDLLVAAAAAAAAAAFSAAFLAFLVCGSWPSASQERGCGSV